MSEAAERLARACIEHPELYREVWRLDCEDCFRKIAAVFVESPGGALVLWTAGERGPVNRPGDQPDRPVKAERRSPVALHLPWQAGQQTQARTAICPRCRKGKLLLPDIGRVLVLGSLEPASFGRVVPDAG